MGTIRAVIFGIRQGIKYRPTIVAMVKEARGPATEYARTNLEAQRQKRLAVNEAATLHDGMVLRMLRGETVVWVVFSGDQTVSAHPHVDVPLDELVAHVDLGQRRRPDAYPSTRQRARRAGSTAARSFTRQRQVKARDVEQEPQDRAVDPRDPSADSQDAP